MVKQFFFIAALLVAATLFLYTARRIGSYFKMTRAAFPVRDFGKRAGVMFRVAIGQSRIFRRPVIGFFHALVFWGFCIILFGSIEMIIDGLAGTERSLKFSGPFYDFMIGTGDLFALLVAFSIGIFLFRRLFLHIRRFQGIEMKHVSHLDANIALSLILLLMISLLGMNSAYYSFTTHSLQPVYGFYPVSQYLSALFTNSPGATVHLIYEICWWSHILLIFLFANILPYSKHFHVFMSVPNVFLSRLEPLGKLTNMDSVTVAIKMMMDPTATDTATETQQTPERFGIRDAEDLTWKNYLDALSCTECGRCTSVCPANLTGKRLSPRKIMMDARARMKEKGPGLVSKGRSYSDNKALLRDYISEEELWACTTCNACARECPVSINHPAIIVDLRRYLVMEEASAPGGLKSIFSNIENNGAPWQYSPEDRLKWSENLTLKSAN
ncbi:MAG TPA: 4Fe-4S dicluster domain-containing protein [Bacteroidales bacterium]|nr:4Fe-4S dicluster domain-containing protein [Bacteroidales bacterium]HPT09560.1 4Fe-4S dicluster domain-containing protein [Bacteroidales bacterium]